MRLKFIVFLKLLFFIPSTNNKFTLSTATSQWTLEEWIDILNECVKTDTPLEVMFDLPVGEDVDY